MSNNEVAVNPGELVRKFRESYVNVHEVKRRVPSAFDKAQVSTPRETPIRENELPQGVRSLLQDYRQSNPGSRLTLLKYQRLENGQPVRVIEDESGLPEEDKLLSLSQTVTLITSAEVRVITDIVVASIEKGER